MDSYTKPGNNPFYIGKSVIIRLLQPEDAALVYSWMKEKFYYYYKPYLKTICPSESVLAQRIQAIASFDTLLEIEALVLHRLSDTPIGLVALSNIDNINQKAEFSIAFRRGLGTRCVAETLWVLFQHMFVTLRFNKLYFYVTSDNEKILKIVHRYNIVQEGKLYKEVLLETGKWLDLYRFCILRQDWTKSPLCKRLTAIFNS